MEPASKTNQQFVYLLNIMHIYVVAKLLTFFFGVFRIFYMGFKFRDLFTIAKNAKLSTD